MSLKSKLKTVFNTVTCKKGFIAATDTWVAGANLISMSVSFAAHSVASGAIQAGVSAIWIGLAVANVRAYDRKRRNRPKDLGL